MTSFLANTLMGFLEEQIQSPTVDAQELESFLTDIINKLNGAI